MARPRKHPKEELVPIVQHCWLRPTRAAEYMNVSYPTFIELEKENGFPESYRLGSSMRLYDSRELDKWIRSHQTEMQYQALKREILGR